ncbi:SMP-30/gluconolactonase/LRE family protein [Micromonospora chersina]|uniref:SMP-30/gluconolactonase/LRE family protein n=1 Tax=Micromonospora chersina TaxID=47854 RepID=UPI0034010F66
MIAPEILVDGARLRRVAPLARRAALAGRLGRRGGAERRCGGPDPGGARADGLPICFDWLPDGRLLVVAAAPGLLLCREPDGALRTHADLAAPVAYPWNEVVTDALGNGFVNTIGFDFPGGDFRPGAVVLVAPDGGARLVADDLAFPNGMALTRTGAPSTSSPHSGAPRPCPAGRAPARCASCGRRPRPPAEPGWAPARRVQLRARRGIVIPSISPCPAGGIDEPPPKSTLPV